MSVTSVHKNDAVLLVLGGLAAGFLNGLLGAGGGILAVLVLGKTVGRAHAVDSRDLFAGALVSMFPVTVVSLIGYAMQGAVSMENAEILVLPAIAGGVGGAFLLDRLKVETLKRIFTVIVILSGIILLVRG